MDAIDGPIESIVLRNNRKKFFTNTKWKTLRQNGSSEHYAELITSLTGATSYPQKHCVWCCERVHTTDPSIDNSTNNRKRKRNKDGKCNRRGYKTRHYCFACKVPLCISKDRYNGRSCYELWHEAEKLNNPCGADEANRPKKRARKNHETRENTDNIAEIREDAFEVDNNDNGTGDGPVDTDDEESVVVTYSPRKLRPRTKDV